MTKKELLQTIKEQRSELFELTRGWEGSVLRDNIEYRILPLKENAKGYATFRYLPLERKDQLEYCAKSFELVLEVLREKVTEILENLEKMENAFDILKATRPKYKYDCEAHCATDIIVMLKNHFEEEKIVDKNIQEEEGNMTTEVLEVIKEVVRNEEEYLTNERKNMEEEELDFRTTRLAIVDRDKSAEGALEILREFIDSEEDEDTLEEWNHYEVTLLKSLLV